ncbi:hypothetical protein BGZ92_000686 [Podila epicladia]|nr:hypothetical protein BGZ92_000686 [Podila epicladia]
MPAIDPALLPISAPILVPGTQRQPTTPSLGSSNTSTSTTIIVTNEQGGSLRRFPTIGNTKKLSLENLTLRSKIAELERYLTGLKEELILAHRQIHSKNLEAKISQERKAVEIHELGQHIQRCEFDLLAKTAECEALQNKLMYQTKEQVTKLKHIHMLENEIMDYKRMSVTSGGAASTISTATASNRIMSRHSRNSADLTTTIGTNNNLSINSVRSSTVLEADSMIKQLKEDNARKEDQIKELTERLEKLEKLGLERAQGQEGGDKAQEVNEEKHQNTISGSSSNASFNTASTTAQQSQQQQRISTSSSVNSVGYDVSVEHPKLLAKFQALRMSHAQASEYVDSLENENRELKVQLLEVTPAPLSLSDITDCSSVIAPTPVKSISTVLLTPLDTDSATKDDHPSIPSIPSPASSNSSSASPSLAAAPALTPKSSLRYNRDGQSSPTPSA